MKMIEPLPSMRRENGTLKRVSSSQCSQNNFHRIFYNQALPVLNVFANKQTRILLYFLYNADGNNMVYCTYKDIMEACDIRDRSTVSETLKQLIEMEVLVKVSTSRYMLNPAVALKGNNQKFGMLASHFNACVFEKKRSTHQKEERN